MPEIVVWGRRPPPLGGVTRCVQGLANALTRAGVDHVVVDWRERRAARTIATGHRASLHLHNVSSVPRLGFVVLARWLTGVRSIVYYHSGTLATQLESPFRRGIARYGFRLVDEVWVTNAALAELVREISGVETRVVSPFSASGSKRIEGRVRPQSVILFVGYGKDLYGLSTAVKVKQLDAMTGWSWTVVAYGDVESCDRIRKVAEREGFRALVNVQPQDVARIIAEHAVLLRPTTADGDAMVIREAMASGARVVASDVVPRPPGVELCSLDPGEIAETLIHGGRLSDGAGLGDSVADAVLTAIGRSQGPGL